MSFRNFLIALSVVTCLLLGLTGCGGDEGSLEGAQPPSQPSLAPSTAAPPTVTAPAAVPPTAVPPTAAPSTAAPSTAAPSTAAPSTAAPLSRSAAMHFLQQSTFGPTESDIQSVQALGIEAWIDHQIAIPFTDGASSQLGAIAQYLLQGRRTDVNRIDVLNSFWNRAIAAPDQLRWRVAFALSQIFVVSFSETALSKDASLSAMADYSDVLARGAFGPYRSVLGEVTMHPVMGIYLNSLGNRAEDPITGRLPDENYAREVMQLFSIGLVRLDDSAEPVRGANGAPIPTYTSGDVSGLAKVFTGLGLNCPEAIRFPYISACASGARRLPMKGDPRHHSTSEKRFLGMTIPAQVGVAPESDISQALDLLAGHPNTAPFIVRQLIQRLVGSSPSSQYVSSVVSVWRSTGGNLGRVVKAILLHPEARGTVQPDGVVRSSNPGRLREPVLRFTQLLRAFSPSSRSGFYMIGRTSDPATQLGMTAFFAPSVFNFYRPGFLAPGSLTAAQGLTAPELQMAGEINAAGWVNFVRSGLSDGWGLDPVSKRTDVELTLDAAERLAPKPAELLDFVSQRLLVEPLPVDVQNTIIAVISSVPLPQSGAVGEAARNRVRACILLIVVSPHYQVQS